MTEIEWRVLLLAQRFIDYPIAGRVCPGGAGGAVCPPMVPPLNAIFQLDVFSCVPHALACPNTFHIDG